MNFIFNFKFKWLKLKYNFKIEFLSHTSHISGVQEPCEAVETLLDSPNREHSIPPESSIGQHSLIKSKQPERTLKIFWNLGPDCVALLLTLFCTRSLSHPSFTWKYVVFLPFPQRSLFFHAPLNGSTSLKDSPLLAAVELIAASASHGF